MAVRLCALYELPEGEGREFALEGKDAFFVVRRGASVYAYDNRCPHTGVSLNWQPGVFLNWQGDLIQCATHGALFRIEDGFCVYGPCSGRSLEVVPTKVCDGIVVLE